MSLEWESCQVVVVDYGISQVLYDIISGDSFMVIFGQVPCLVVGIEVSDYSFIV